MSGGAGSGGLHIVASRTAADTLALGAALARAVQPSLATQSRAFALHLSGPLGAGKTTLVRGALAALGVTTVVRSPSYALMECYETPACRALHVDLYRLRVAGEIENLGLRDFDQPGVLWLVEWPERAQGLLPPPDIFLQLSFDEELHRIELTPGSAAGSGALAALEYAGDTS